jgi:riboflavin biosynthesis pyrimidine reductase
MQSDAKPGDLLSLKTSTAAGARADATFLRHGLVDEFQFFVNPVVPGQGRRLFDGPDMQLKA